MSSTTVTLNLFTPVKVGHMQLLHRVVMAPMARFRAREWEHVPLVNLMKEYYTQRTRRAGSFVVTEATFIAARAGGYKAGTGIWSQEQIDAWKEIVSAVHEQGSFIYLQMMALGRGAGPDVLAAEGFEMVSASAIPIGEGYGTPRALTVEEIHEYVEDFATAARNAVFGAGFDGVEIHCANGYLPDQFLQDVSNNRTDEYGGSIENRSRFPIEITNAVVAAVGAERTGIRVSPWGTYQSMRMVDPVPQFSHFIKSVLAAHPDLAYLHAVEPEHPTSPSESNDFLRDIWSPKPFISAGDHTRESAISHAEKKGDIVAFGRWYISNPDLVHRLEKNIPLSPYDRATFYTHGSPIGYIDYPFADMTNA